MKRSIKWAIGMLLAACVVSPVAAFAETPVDLSASETAKTVEVDSYAVSGDALQLSVGADLFGSAEDEIQGSDENASDNSGDDANLSGGDGIEDDAASEGDDSASDANSGTDSSDKAAAEPGSDKASASVAESKDNAASDGPAAASGSAGKTTAAKKTAASVKGSLVPMNVTAVYVNGDSGNDSNDGTSATQAVKTFAKAKEFMKAYGCDVIYVLGALQVSGDAGIWELDGKILARGDDYHGELITLLAKKNAILSLRNIILDGRADEGQYGRTTNGWGGGGSLIGMYDGSVLNLYDGAVLKNNRILNEGTWYPEAGGGIALTESTLNMYGGLITGCEAVNGGGIYGTYNSVININGGEISGNRAVQGSLASKGDNYAGFGGGICVFDGADINMNGGLIANNSAYVSGGGISLGTAFGAVYGSSVLTMKGGTVSGNTAGATGGGIFVQSGLSASGNKQNKIDTHSLAYIHEGKIIGNKTTGRAGSDNAFGGGGIYVNGYASQYRQYKNGELHLYNVVVADNYAALLGGGYAGCPVSKLTMYQTNGSVFFGNNTGLGLAKEIYILATTGMGVHSGNPSYLLSPFILGGGSARWVYDNGSEVTLDMLKYTLNQLYDQCLSVGNLLNASDPDVIAALGMGKVFITGNSSFTRGGGIGSNGTVYIGEKDTYALNNGVELPGSVMKNWADADNKDGIRPRFGYLQALPRW